MITHTWSAESDTGLSLQVGGEGRWSGVGLGGFPQAKVGGRTLSHHRNSFLPRNRVSQPCSWGPREGSPPDRKEGSRVSLPDFKLGERRTGCLFPGEPFSFSASHAALCSPTAGQSGRSDREFQTSQGPPQPPPPARGIHGPPGQVLIHLGRHQSPGLVAPETTCPVFA